MLTFSNAMPAARIATIQNQQQRGLSTADTAPTWKATQRHPQPYSGESQNCYGWAFSASTEVASIFSTCLSLNPRKFTSVTAPSC